MEKPELADYGLKGIDSRPQIDVDSSPINDEEAARAYRAMLEWFAGSERVSRFRVDLLEWDLQERGL